MKDLNKFNFLVDTLGKCSISSPIILSHELGDYIANFASEDQLIIYDVLCNSNATVTYPKEVLLERAGPREKIFFDPSKVNAGIVTCGGLCPGLNDVIRAIVMCLWYRYGVRKIYGIRNGYRGFLPEYKLPVMDLSPTEVTDIHRTGGTILGSSRGSGDRVVDIVDCIERMNLSMLFTIGGDGTQRGAMKIADEAKRRNLKLAVIGIPKTIDNDLYYIQKSFGFETAVSHAVRAVTGAHTEAHDAINGVGIVKLMGRESGFIAVHTALATNDVNFVLIPEVPFDLEGENGLMRHLYDRIKSRNHACIVVAEGAGQDLLPVTKEIDPSGNIKLHDIGIFLKDKIAEYFNRQKTEVNIRYIDPGYMIRSSPSDPNDSLYCARLGTNAVHAAMAGRTKMLISLVNNHFVHVPISAAVSKRNRVDPETSLWRDVIEATGQPPLMKNKK